MNKRFHMKTYGCQMNVYDSDAMKNLLFAQNWREVSEPHQADLVILNTCHIREKATEKIYSEIGRLKKLKQNRSAEKARMMIAVAGCVAQAEGHAMQARAPAIDFIFGPQAFHLLPDMISRAQAGEKTIAVDFSTHEKLDALAKMPVKKNSVSAFLTIQEGCDKFCSFCVVPYVRGAEVSRPADDIIAEAEKLITNGAREIILLGQNVNAFRYQARDGKVWQLSDLLNRLGALSGLRRLRYTTSHPKDMIPALIRAHGDNAKLMPLLHLPVQSGSDRILEKMNRRHSVAHYYQTICALRKARPDIALSSDFIVGFPGETEEDFAATLNLIERVGFTQAYSFKYSPRPGTPAASEPQIPESIKSARLSLLRALLDKQSLAFNQKMTGQKLDVLMEESDMGKTPYGQRVHIKSRHKAGDIIPVKITHGAPHHLIGDIAL